MTARFVRMLGPLGLQTAQLVTLFVTMIVGASIWVTPANRDAKLSVIEQTMDANVWAATLMICAALAFICELDMIVRKHTRWINIVAGCHIILCGLFVGYSFAALVGVLYRAWWNFGAPALGLLCAYWHLVFTQRRPHKSPRDADG